MQGQLVSTAIMLMAAGLCMGDAAWADDSIAPLEEVVVKGQGLSQANTSFSATRLDAEQIRQSRVSRVQELFNQVPGMENRGLQIGGVADSITLRGFAGGGHGGDLGAVVDGVPINEPTSHADGYVDFNIVVPLELRGMTVYRGPVSALYGNYARAGVVALESRKGGNYREADFSVGSFGTMDSQVALGVEQPGLRINLAAQGWRTDGARDHSAWSRGTFAARAAIDVTPDVELALTGRFHRGVWDATARVTQEAMDDKDRTWRADPHAQDDGGDKTYASLRADLGVRLGEQAKLLAFVHVVDQSFLRFSTFAPDTYPDPVGEPWPQRKEDYDRGVLGAGVNINGRNVLAGSAVDWVAGIEKYRDSTESRFRGNLLNRKDSPATLDGVSRLVNREMRFDSTSLFGQAEWAWRTWLRPSIGVRHDRFDGLCTPLGTEVDAGGCGRMNRYANTSPKFGVRSTVAPWLDLRASLTEGFQLPGDAAKYVSGGRVRPTRFRQTEVGTTARLGADALLDMAAFRIDSSDEIYLSDAATATYSNLGSTRRQGLEVDLRYAPAPDWDFYAVGSWFTSEVRDSSSAGNVGKKIPNTPRHMLTIGAIWRPAPSWSAHLGIRQVGRYTADAANVHWYKGYTVARLGVEFQRTGAGGGRQRYYATLDNLFDRRYAASASVTNDAWFYAPGAPRTLTLGVQFDF